MGVIRGLFQLGQLAVAVHDAVDQRMETAAAMEEANRELAQGGVSALERDMHLACTGPASGIVLLVDNDWSRSEVDSVRTEGRLDVVAPSGAKSGGPEGFFNVCAGRHVVVTKSASGGAALLRFMLYPGELIARRLDRQTGQWAACDAATAAKLVARVDDRSLPLIDYFAEVAKPRLRAHVVVSGYDAAREAHVALLDLIERIDAGHAPAEMVGAAQQIAAGLVGVPIGYLEGILTAIGSAAWERASKGDFDRAWLILNLGLVLLPDDSTLLAVMGELMIQRGQVQEGLGHLDQALSRERGMSPMWLERARAARDGARAI